MPRLTVSATRGGLGKTTLSLGIVTALRKRGHRVSVFKKGPDFIDAGWLGAAAGGACYNLDLFMMEQEAVLGSFHKHSIGADVALIEGNRGLFDGVDESGTFSTARLAQILSTPVVLIVDCTKSSGTVGAVVLGCREFDAGVDLRGVILNNVSSARHEAVVRRAVEQRSGIRVVGAVPRRRKGEFPERHMGLTPFQEHPEVEHAISSAAEIAEKYLDIDALWNIASSATELNIPDPVVGAPHGEAVRDAVTVGVVRDRAFQFYYPDNLEALERCGARVVEINALLDSVLPEIDALYIGGGFPETHAAALSSNTALHGAIRKAADAGMPIYAECGGLIYLGRSLQLHERIFPMTGVLPVDFVLEQRPQAHGYTVLEVTSPDTFLEKGSLIRGHEFHYSRISNRDPVLPMAYRMNRGAGIAAAADGLMYKNVLACYTHLHALGTPAWAPAVVRKAGEYRAVQGQQRKQGVH